MKRAKVFSGMYRNPGIERQGHYINCETMVNHWVDQHPEYEILDIDVTTDGDWNNGRTKTYVVRYDDRVRSFKRT